MFQPDNPHPRLWLVCNVLHSMLKNKIKTIVIVALNEASCSPCIERWNSFYGLYFILKLRGSSIWQESIGGKGFGTIRTGCG